LACYPVALLLLDPLIGEPHWRPAITTPRLLQAAQARKQHMRPRDHNIFARELRQQLMPCRRSRGRVDVEDHCDFWVPQLDALWMNGVAPKQNLLFLRRKFMAGMSGGTTVQRNKLHALYNRLGACERVPLAGPDVRRCD